jgi:hypothetical protein
MDLVVFGTRTVVVQVGVEQVLAFDRVAVLRTVGYHMEHHIEGFGTLIFILSETPMKPASN